VDSRVFSIDLSGSYGYVSDCMHVNGDVCAWSGLKPQGDFCLNTTMILH
jgi:hypothetical protein